MFLKSDVKTFNCPQFYKLCKLKTYSQTKSLIPQMLKEQNNFGKTHYD